MEEMCESFGPVLPGMRARIFADEGSAIIGAVDALVISPQRGLVVLDSSPKISLKGAFSLVSATRRSQ